MAAPSVLAQYMYLDANGDGVHTASDRLNVPGGTTVDIWLDTDSNRDGSTATCAAGGLSPMTAMTVSSYQFILKVEGGTVGWGTYFNNQAATMGISLGEDSSPTEFRVGYGGLNSLSPGLYKLGTINCFVTFGSPTVSIEPTSSQGGAFLTAFGSGCPGAEGDNTLKLSTDWFDADGLLVTTANVLLAETFDSGSLLPKWTTSYTSGYNSAVWGMSGPGCGYYAGSYSASGAGSFNCNSYPANINNALTLQDTYLIYASRFQTYQFAFSERHNLTLGSPNDVLRYSYLAGPSPFSLTNLGGQDLTGNQASWTRRVGGAVDNSSFQNNYVKPVFGMFTYRDSPFTTPYYGAWIDSVQLFGTARPDLKVVADTVEPCCGSPALVAGQSCYLKFTVKNVGDLSTTLGFTVRVRLKRSDGAETDVGTPSYSALASGATVSATVTGSVPTAGSYRMLLNLDFGGAITESASDDEPELNNAFTSSKSFTWAPPPAPDLTVSTFTAPATAQMGQTIDVTVGISNTGSASATGPFRVAFYRDRTSPPSVGTAPDSFIQVSSLAASQSATYTFRSYGAYGGTDSMYAFVDYQNAVQNEISETNNISGPRLVTRVPKTVVVRGRFVFKDSLLGDSTTTPCNEIVLYDWDSLTKIDKIAGLVAAQASGLFEFPAVQNLDEDGGFLDLFVQSYYKSNEACWRANFPGNWFLNITHANDSLWYYQSDIHKDWSGDTLWLGDLKPADYGQRAVAHMFNELVDRGWWFAKGLVPADSVVKPVTIRWDPGRLFESGYRMSSSVGSVIDFNGYDSLLIFSPDEYDDAVLVHEYGHHIGRWNGFDVGDLSQDHFLNSRDSTKQDAWVEGWATFFSGMSQNYPGQPGYGVLNDFGRSHSGSLRKLALFIEGDSLVYYKTPDYTQVDSTYHFTYPQVSSGPFWEGSVAGTLWDLVDANDDKPPGVAFGDSVSDGMQTLWSVLTQFPPALAYDKFKNIDSLGVYYLRSTVAPGATSGDYLRRMRVRQVFFQHGMFDSLPVAVERVLQSPSAEGPRVRAYPNPFNPSTRIEFSVRSGARKARTTLRLFNVAGRMVRQLVDTPLDGGTYTVSWDGALGSGIGVASGIYLCELRSENRRVVTKLVMTR